MQMEQASVHLWVDNRKTPLVAEHETPIGGQTN